MTLEQIITDDVKKHIEDAIRMAELGTSGEVRVHIENKCRENVLDRASFIFAELEMHKTGLRNGVLIYVAVEDKKMAIIGDAAINEKMEDNAWEQIKSDMLNHFRGGDIESGIIQGVKAVGEKIKVFFPIHADDTNELSNEVTFGPHKPKQKK